MVVFLFQCSINSTMDLHRQSQRHQLSFKNADSVTDQCKKLFISDASKIIQQINNIRNTIYSLEESFDISRCLEVKQHSMFLKIKICNGNLLNNLKEIEQRNRTMLNLFRANVTDDLPINLKNQVKRSWQQKYDALLNMNTKLKRETHLKDITIKEKNDQISILQQKLLNMSENLINYNEPIKNSCNKHLTLEK